MWDSHTLLLSLGVVFLIIWGMLLVIKYQLDAMVRTLLRDDDWLTIDDFVRAGCSRWCCC